MNFSNWFAGWQSHEGVNQEKLCQWGFLNRERGFSHLLVGILRMLRLTCFVLIGLLDLVNRIALSCRIESSKFVSGAGLK